MQKITKTKTKEDILSAIVHHLLNDACILFTYDQHSQIGDMLYGIVNELQDLRHSVDTTPEIDEAMNNSAVGFAI